MTKDIIWDKIGRVCIYLLFGLVPVFFLPFTAFPVVENKTMLAGALVFIAFGAWLAKILNVGRFSLLKTRFWLVGAAFLLITVISTFVSLAPQVSLWGNVGSPDSLFNILVFGLVLFLTPLFLRDLGELIKALLFFSVSLIILSVFSILQFFGIFLLPFDFTRQITFNPIGTVQALAIFLGSGLVMIVALLTSFKLSAVLKIVFSFCAALLSLILILVNFNYVWLGIMFASALVVAWQVMHSRRSIRDGDESKGYEGMQGENSQGEYSRGEPTAMLAPKFGLPLVLMVIVAILFFVQPPISAIVRLPAEVRPSLSATLDVAKGALGSGVTNAIFGSGPGTFLYEYLLHRSSDLNATAFWGVRFSQGFATFPTLLINLGILGIAALSAMIGFFTFLAFRGVAALSRKKSPAERIALISFVSFLFLILSWFYYPVDFTILLFTFLFAGLVLAAIRAGGGMEEIEISLLKTPQRTFVASLAIIVLIVVVVVGLYWQGQKYIASVVHTLGVQAYNQRQDIDTALRHIGLAVNLDNNQDRYWRTFTQLLALRMQEVLRLENIDQVELQRRYQVVLQSTIQAGQQATKANSADPLNWRQLAAVYEDNIAIVGGADNFSIQNYEEAAKRNPQNPLEYLNVARAYVRSADTAANQAARLSQGKDAKAQKDEIEKLQQRRNEQLARALENLQTAISLKRDYAPAHFLASQVYERQGNRALAIQKTLETKNLNPLDTGVGYQLGLLYYVDNQTEKARDEFERVVGLSETFSNARYFLGLSYDRLGQKQKAIAQFTRIEELNPGNDEVTRILKNLRAGKEALAEIVPPAAPPQERIGPPVEQTGGEEPATLQPQQPAGEAAPTP